VYAKYSLQTPETAVQRQVISFFKKAVRKLLSEHEDPDLSSEDDASDAHGPTNDEEDDDDPKNSQAEAVELFITLTYN
jgi:hypothetical protein